MTVKSDVVSVCPTTKSERFALAFKPTSVGVGGCVGSGVVGSGAVVGASVGGTGLVKAATLIVVSLDTPSSEYQTRMTCGFAWI